MLQQHTRVPIPLLQLSFPSVCLFCLPLILRSRCHVQFAPSTSWIWPESQSDQGRLGPTPEPE